MRIRFLVDHAGPELYFAAGSVHDVADAVAGRLLNMGRAALVLEPVDEIETADAAAPETTARRRSSRGRARASKGAA